MECLVTIIDKDGKVLKSDWALTQNLDELQEKCNVITTKIENKYFVVIISDNDTGEIRWKQNGVWITNQTIEIIEDINLFNLILTNPLRTNINFRSTIKPVVEYLKIKKLKLDFSIEDIMNAKNEDNYYLITNLKELLSEKFANISIEFFDDAYGYFNPTERIFRGLDSILEEKTTDVATEALSAYLFNIFEKLTDVFTESELYDFIKYEIYDKERPTQKVNYGSIFDKYDLGPWTKDE